MTTPATSWYLVLDCGTGVWASTTGAVWTKYPGGTPAADCNARSCSPAKSVMVPVSRSTFAGSFPVTDRLSSGPEVLAAKPTV